MAKEILVWSCLIERVLCAIKEDGRNILGITSKSFARFSHVVAHGTFSFPFFQYVIRYNYALSVITALQVL